MVTGCTRAGILKKFGLFFCFVLFFCFPLRLHWQFLFPVKTKHNIKGLLFPPHFPLKLFVLHLRNLLQSSNRWRKPFLKKKSAKPQNPTILHPLNDVVLSDWSCSGGCGRHPEVLRSAPTLCHWCVLTPPPTPPPVFDWRLQASARKYSAILWTFCWFSSSLVLYFFFFPPFFFDLKTFCFLWKDAKSWFSSAPKSPVLSLCECIRYNATLWCVCVTVLFYGRPFLPMSGGARGGLGEEVTWFIQRLQNSSFPKMR